jgi:prepilin signal peptidase PulO-like enzyme (type II secretory pathway)
VTAYASLAAYLSALLALLALARREALRHGDAFRLGRLAIAGVFLGAVVALRCRSSALDIVLASTIVGAITDVSSGYVYDAVLLPAAIGLTIVELSTGTLYGCCMGGATSLALSGLVHGASRGEGLGLGDVKLFGLIGAALSPSYGALVFGAAFVFGSAVLVGPLLAGRIQRTQRIAFAPYITASTIAVALAGRIGS